MKQNHRLLMATLIIAGCQGQMNRQYFSSISWLGDQYSGVASGINNALSRVASVFANAIFGALAVLLFTSMLEQRLAGYDLPAGTKRAAIAQAANLGNAKPPPEIPEGYIPALKMVYRAGFIQSYQRHPTTAPLPARQIPDTGRSARHAEPRWPLRGRKSSFVALCCCSLNFPLKLFFLFFLWIMNQR